MKATLLLILTLAVLAAPTMALGSPPPEVPAEELPAPEPGPAPRDPDSCDCPDDAKQARGKAVFEIVLGTGLIFDVEDSFNYADDVEVTPISSVYLTGELFLSPRWRVSLGYELPIGLQTRIVSGQVEEKILPSVLELGVVVVPIWIDFAEHSRIEIQLVASTGLTIAAPPLAYPRIGFRLNFLQDATKGIGLLFGVNHSFRLGRLAFFYGAGYRF